MWTNQFDWNGEGVEDELRKLHADGDPATEIAYALMKKFGGTLTRSAVLGKINRLGLSVPTHKRTADPKRARPKNINSTMTLDGHPILDTDAPSPIDLSPDEIPMRQRKQILDLKKNDCRWPYGDVGNPDFFFCGAETVKCMSYCAFHCRMAYQKFHISDSTAAAVSRANAQRIARLGMLRSEPTNLV